MLHYPVTRKEEHKEEHFGVTIEDPYRWLEDDQSAETAQFVDAQNALTKAYMEKIPGKDRIQKRLTELMDYEKYSAFRVDKDRIIFHHNSGLQNQFVIYEQKGLDGDAELVLDPNKLSDDGTVSVALLRLSKNGKYLPYLISESGSDWQTLKILDMETKENLPDELTWVKFTGAAWEGNGFYYSRYDAPEAGSELSAKNEYQKIYYHELGTEQSQDRPVFEDPEHPLRYYDLETSKDEEEKFITVSEGTYGTEILYFDKTSEEFRPIFKGFHADRYFVGKYDGKLLFMTDEDCPNLKLVSFDPKTDQIEDILPEAEHYMVGATENDGYLLVEYLADVASKLLLVNLKTGEQKEIELPGLGNLLQYSGSEELGGFLFSFSSYVTPLTIYFYDFKTSQTSIFKEPELPIDMSQFVTERHFVEASDGARVPLFLSYRKDLKLDGKNPAFLYAYGGFSSPILIGYSASVAYLMEEGFVYAHAGIRGGSEYGEKWHKEGMLLNKQRGFDDFHECAEYLIDKGFCSSETLAIEGRSNGGLLIGAVLNQHPELYRVAFPTVGVMDMLRYHLFTVGWGWVPEYGNPEEEEHFHNILKYSPLHNIEEKNYPSVMIRTADHDDRVVPAHSFKYGATLQEKNLSENPILMRIDKKAGHGMGKPLSMVIEELADVYAFMMHEIKQPRQ